MFTRIVGMILIPTVLLTQWASFGHTHPGSHEPSHDDSPHFHTNFLVPERAHHHGHHHHHGHSHHHAHHHHDQTPESDDKTRPASEPLSSDHDSDAVDCVNFDVLVDGRFVLDEHLTSSFLTILDDARVLGTLQDAVLRDSIVQAHPPDWPPGYSCPLYIHHSVLLI